MATEVKRRRGSDSDHVGFTGAVAELTVNTDDWTVHVHDGTNSYGYPLLRADFSNATFTTPDARYLLETNNLSDLTNASTARTNLGVAIGTNVQAWDAQLDTLSGLSADQATAIVAVTASEYQQLQNINSVTISNTQWGYLGELDQSLTQASSPTFSGLTVDGLVVEDEIRTLQSDVIENHLEIESLQHNKVELGELFPDLDKQALGTGDSVTFGGLTVNGNISVTGTVDGRDVAADGADLDELYTTIGLSALTASEVDQLENINSVTISNTQWGYLGELDQSLTTTSAVTFTTVNTGQGANELYAMNQDVQTTDNVTFNGLTANGATDLNSTLNVQGVLTTQNNVLDDGFSEGWSGTNWRITADGSAELEELRVRGALRVYEFIAKQISTIGGSEILSIAQGRVSSVSVGDETITVENVTGTAGNAFKANDLWICQVTDINNDLESGGTGSIVKSVRGTVTSVSGNDIVVTIDAGDISELEQGDLIIAYGNTSDADRQAIMYRNVDRSEDNLIMRLQTQINSFADLQAVGNTRVAFGDLNGYSGLSAETFGFFAGDNTNEHILVTDGGLFLKDGTTVLAQLTSNTFKVGDSTNFLSFDGTTFDIQTDTFNLDTTNLDISSANENIVIGTGSALMTVGKLSSVEQGIKIDSSGITNQNYWKLGQGDVQFKVGDGTNFLSFNENAGTFNIESQAFKLDATDASGGIKIDSTNELIQLEDANRVRTQVDVNNGTFSLTETSEYNAGDATVINQGAPSTSSAFQTTKGDSLYIDIGAELTSLGADGTEAYIQVQALGSTSSGGTYTSFASFLGPVLTSTGNSGSVKFSAHSYSYDWVKIRITVFSNDTALNAQFELNQNIIVKSYDSQTRLSLDGLFVNSSNTQYARLTRSENELSGIIKMKNLPTSDPQVEGVVYRDASGNLKVSL